MSLNKLVHTSGSLGDVFIIIHKLKLKNITKVKHFTVHKNILDSIKTLYSLSGVECEFSKTRQPDSIKGYFERTYKDLGIELDLPNISSYKLPEKYNVIQLKSGVKNTSSRVLTKKNLDMIDKSIPSVLVGTDNIKIVGDFIDLRNKTSISEAFSIIKQSNHFYGPQGLLNFYSSSIKKDCTIFLKDNTDVHAVNHRVKKVNSWKVNTKYIRDF